MLQQKFTSKPAILKPLKLIRPSSRAVKPKWVYGNPWALDDPKVIGEGGFCSMTSSLTNPSSYDRNQRPKTMGHLNGSNDVKYISIDSLDLKSPTKEKPKNARTKSDWGFESSNEKSKKAKSAKETRRSKSGKNGLIFNSKVAPLEPLPSMAMRKSMIASRGNRTVHDDELKESSKMLSAIMRKNKVAVPITRYYKY